MQPDRVWTSSVFGRVLGTALGLFCLALPWGPTGTSLTGDVIVTAVGVVILIAVWTSRLVLTNGNLTSTNFFISTSVPLRDVVAVEPVLFLGMWIRRKGGLGIPTLVTFRPIMPWGTPRADRLGAEIVALANLVRAGSDIPPQRSKPTGSPGGLHTKP